MERKASTDLTALAAAAFDKSKPAAERDEYIRHLMQPLAGLAWSIAQPDNDLAEELRSHVLTQCERECYNPAAGPFLAWARRVMTNRLITLLDPRNRGEGGDTPREDPIDRKPTTTDDSALAPFSSDDLARIRKWKPRQRVILLCRTLLWQKLPAEEWAATLKAAGLPRDFPNPEFDDLDQTDRTAYLGKAFGVPPNTINVNWKRWKRHVLELKFVRELRTANRER